MAAVSGLRPGGAGEQSGTSYFPDASEIADIYAAREHLCKLGRQQRRRKKQLDEECIERWVRSPPGIRGETPELRTAVRVEAAYFEGRPTACAAPSSAARIPSSVPE